MPDFDLEKQLKEGMDFKKIFQSILLYSVSLFLALWWSDYIKSVINAYIPSGTGFISKFIVGIIITAILVSFCYLLMKNGKAK